MTKLLLDLRSEKIRVLVMNVVEIKWLVTIC